MDIDIRLEKAKPFLRWAGGKRWFIKHLKNYLPQDINNFHEPFLGSGSVFFEIENISGKYFISDLNAELINTYIQLRDDINPLINNLKRLKNSESEYYRIRNLKAVKASTQASKFIYLNKLSYNGIYRVNKEGGYNVPYGFRGNIDIVCEDNLRLVSKRLQSVNIEPLDFQEALKKVKKGDFVFLDPPYTVAHENNGFIEYNKKLFSVDDQINLCDSIVMIQDLGAKYILTNAKHDAIKKIYKKLGEPIILSRNSSVGGNGAKRGEFREYIFTNCINRNI